MREIILLLEINQHPVISNEFMLQVWILTCLL